MMILPEGAFTVAQDEAVVVEKKVGGIILDIEEHNTKPKKPNTGVIFFTAPELKKYQGCKVVFRENFGEDITIGAAEYLYFRDFNSSIYYVIEDKK
jgi:hypothetical protein